MTKLLVIRFSALGDVAMLAAIVREVAEQHADVEVTVVSRPFCAPLFEGISGRVHFFPVDPKKGEYKGQKGMWRLFKRLDKEHFDYVCDMHDVLRTKMLRLFFVLAGYKVSHIDKHRALRKRLTAQGSKKRLMQLPTSFDNYRAALPPELATQTARFKEDNTDACFKEDNTDNRDNFFGGSEHPSRIMESDIVSSKLSDGAPLISLAPFAAHGGKIYPLEKMHRVVEIIIERQPDVKIMLFGGGGKEAELMTAWEKEFPGNVEATSVRLQERRRQEPDFVPMREELRLMRQSDVMVSMDSGNMHLASLVGTRVVSIWGATHPMAGFLGWHQDPADCVQVDLPCRPCSIFGKKPCLRGDMACMNQITPEMIVDRIFTYKQ